VALLAAVALEAAREQRVAEASVAWTWALRAWRAILRIPGDVLVVALAALEQLTSPVKRRGKFEAASFAHGSPSDPRAAGRRAMAEAFGSLAPNTIVIGIDRERNLIIAHRLRARDGPA